MYLFCFTFSRTSHELWARVENIYQMTLVYCLENRLFWMALWSSLLKGRIVVATGGILVASGALWLLLGALRFFRGHSVCSTLI